MTNFRTTDFNSHSIATWILTTPSPSQTNPCTTLEILPAPMAADTDDPWFWDVDRVVRELCTEQRSWSQTFVTRKMPNPAALEIALREEEIDGSTLLTDVDEGVLEKKLGITKLGQLSSFKQIIRDLRRMSEKYMTWKDTYGSELQLASHAYSGASNAHIRKRSESSQPINHSLQAATHGLSGDINGSHGSSLFQAETRGEQFSVADRSVRGESWIADGAENKRRRLELVDLGAGSELPLSYGDDEIAVGQDVVSPAQVVQDGDNATATVETDAIAAVETTTSGKKRKRIAPTLIISNIDPERNRDIPTFADMVIDNDPQNIEPGVVYIGDDGRKRLMPISQSGPDPDLAKRHQEQLENLDPAHRALQQGGQLGLEAAQRILEASKEREAEMETEVLALGYLGKKKHSVDDVFYQGTAVGGEIQSAADVADDDEDDFSRVTQGTVSEGRRLYIHGLMKRYLRSERQVIHRHGKSFSAIRPYASRLAPMHQAPSFTLFRKSADGQVHAIRENLSRWPEAEPNGPKDDNKSSEHDDERRAHFDLPDNMALGGTSSYDSWDPDTLLDKYRYIEGGEVVLPRYGDSDEEGEYDIETWNEIEEERGTLEKPLISLKRRQLSPEKVNTAIDEGIARIVLKWNTEKLPRRKLQAWKLWKQCRREPYRRQRIYEAKQHVQRINNERLPKMREEILREIWTIPKAVHRQTKIMEQSIFDREDRLWQISTLKGAEPEKPPQGNLNPKVKSKKTETSVEDDGECIESETEIESSDDELDDFIVSDDPDGITAEEGDQRRADDEAESAESDVKTKERYEIPMSPPQTYIPSSPVFPLHKENGAEEENSRPSSPVVSDGKTPVLQKAMHDIVDLTMLTSDTSGAEGPAHLSHIVDLSTPQKPKNKIRLVLKREGTPISRKSQVIHISDSEDIASPAELPPYTDPATIGKTHRTYWQKVEDRERLLIGELYNMNPIPREDLRQLFAAIARPQMWLDMVSVMQAISNGKDAVRGVDGRTFLGLTGVMRLFEMFADCRYRGVRHTLTKLVVDKIEQEEDHFKSFYEICARTLDIIFGKQLETVVDDEEDSEPTPANRRKFRVTP
jgi:hypothetical protein